MCNSLWLCVCLLLPLALGENNNRSSSSNLSSSHLSSDILPAPTGSNNNMSSVPPPTAEQLVRYRRQPPYSLRVSSKRGKQRRRTKSPSPKIKYGPPSYPPASSPPVSYYKPSFPGHVEEPSFSLDDFQHLKFDGADFQLPPSSYEAQSMDLDLYGHDEPDLYGAHKFPSLEYSFTGAGHESSSYELHKPHQKYGVPPQSPPSHSSSYEAPDAYVGQPYETPPAAKYGVPTAHAPAPAPPAPDSYSIYEQKIPNAGYRQHFAEPPRSPNFEISYSPPAYEISTSYQANQPQYSAPAPGHGSYQPPAQDYEHVGGSHESYQPAGQDYQPQPQPPSYHGYQPPDHSYQSHAPVAAPAPAPAPAHVPDHSYQPAGQDFAEPPPSNYAQPEHSYPQENYALPTEELPLSPNHKFPSFDFPKSSYEVPIYDPIPFEASSKDEHESYPPILPDNELPADDAHAAGSSRTPTKSRKRKRPVVSKKHTLDVPELQQAYDADTHTQVRVRVRGTELDTAAHGSSHVEQKRNFLNYVTRPAATAATAATTSTTAAPWSPMHVRTPFAPTVVTPTRSRGSSRYRSRNPAGSSEPAAATVVTVEKSRSQSYYDGTLAPPTYQQQQQQQQLYPVRPTRPAQLRGVLQPGTERNATPKRTTKGIFDTTLFKSPLSERERERKLHGLRQNLPKNHKLY